MDKGTGPMNLKKAIDFVESDDISNKLDYGNKSLDYIPTNNFYIPDGYQTEYKITASGATLPNIASSFGLQPFNSLAPIYNPNNYWDASGTGTYLNWASYQAPLISPTSSRNTLFKWTLTFKTNVNCTYLLRFWEPINPINPLFSPNTFYFNYFTTTGNVAATKTVSGVFSFPEPLTKILPTISAVNAPTYPVQLSAVTFSISQNDPSSSGTIVPIVIPNNSLIEEFQYSDYNTLYGDLYEIADSQYYDLVEYTDYSVPTNYFNLIIVI
jgi:hypothetical protein